MGNLQHESGPLSGSELRMESTPRREMILATPLLVDLGVGAPTRMDSKQRSSPGISINHGPFSNRMSRHKARVFEPTKEDNFFKHQFASFSPATATPGALSKLVN